MGIQIFILLTIGLLASAQASELDFDLVVPFPETEPTTKEDKVALKFKPSLYIRQGCYPYPAVDEDGNTNAGLAPKLLYGAGKCDAVYGASQGSQVYGRVKEYADSWAIMYAWYFPKDTARIPYYWGRRHGWENVIVWLNELSENATIDAVTASGPGDDYSVSAPPAASMVNGTNVKIQYQNTIGTMHYVKVATSPGRFQDLVMWDDLTDAARSSLNDHKFNKAEVPINDANFPTNLKSAYDAWKNES
ncbi:hypothetical protein PHYBOEH_000952 [Phytophthora boehmeriae]|uniref:Necrosis inducing protein NPP1 n=1 Tax=Phytophthora boehmeriae TaxID=109152 RepID=A0A8T1V8N1_9STRA|nr:hypothetical protein PHYBOEH_000952 [Phytophthora boehmeriae]